MKIPVVRARCTILVAMVVLVAGCEGGARSRMSDAERSAVADSIRALVVSAYDLARPEVVARMLSLYPDTGAVISTSSGHVATTRAELEQQIGTFWQYVGSNMREPKWEWTSMRIDVLAPDAAVMTAAYRIPHLTPRNTPHVIAGAWTAAFARRGGRWVIVQEHLSDVPERRAAAGDSLPDSASDEHAGH